jgi:hypothetical protein
LVSASSGDDASRVNEAIRGEKKRGYKRDAQEQKFPREHHGWEPSVELTAAALRRLVQQLFVFAW